MAYIPTNRGTLSIGVIILGNGIGDPSSNPGRDCVSFHANSNGKDMNPSVLLPAMGKE